MDKRKRKRNEPIDHASHSSSSSSSSTSPPPPTAASASASETSKMLIQRIWTDEDVIAILKGAFHFVSETGKDPLKLANAEAFHDFVKKSLHVECSSIQLKDKLRKLRNRFKKKFEKCQDPNFSKPHDQQVFEWSKKVWGSDQGAILMSENPNPTLSADKSLMKRKTVKPDKSLELTESQSIETDLEVKESEKTDIDSVDFNLCEIIRNIGGSFRLDDDTLKRGMELIGEAKRKEFKERWKKLKYAELEIFAECKQLIADQSRVMIEALKSSAD